MSLVDVGMANNYLVKIEANAVFVRATPQVRAAHAHAHSLRLEVLDGPARVREPPGAAALRLSKGRRAGHATATAPPATGAAPENELALDKEREKKAAVEGKLSKLRKAREEHQAVAVVDNDLVLSLANVRNDKDFTYLRFKVINKTDHRLQRRFHRLPAGGKRAEEVSGPQKERGAPPAGSLGRRGQPGDYRAAPPAT